MLGADASYLAQLGWKFKQAEAHDLDEELRRIRQAIRRDRLWPRAASYLRDGVLFTSDVKTKVLLVCGAIAGPLFTIVWLVEGATRPNYDPMRHPISSLAIGERGWTQSVSFIVTGLLMLAFAFGLWRRLRFPGGSRWGPWLIGAIAISFLGAGLFVTDPLNGYPPGTPDLPLQYSVPGRLHRLFSALVFLGLPGACFVMARLFGRWGLDV